MLRSEEDERMEDGTYHNCQTDCPNCMTRCDRQTTQDGRHPGSSHDCPTHGEYT